MFHLNYLQIFFFPKTSHALLQNQREVAERKKKYLLQNGDYFQNFQE